MALGFADGARYSTANKKAHNTESTFKTEANLDDVFFLQLCPVGTPKADQKDENGTFHRRSALSLDNATISTTMLKMKINVWTVAHGDGHPDEDADPGHHRPEAGHRRRLHGLD